MASLWPAADCLAQIVIAGPLDAASIRERCTGHVMVQHARWIASFSKRVVAKFGQGSRPGRRAVGEFIRNDRGFKDAWRRSGYSMQFALPAPVMCPAAGVPETWAVPSLASVGDLMGWIPLTYTWLQWLADYRSLETEVPVCFRRYRYRIVHKRRGEIRLIEAPKRPLKRVQRLLLKELLAYIPPHRAACGFRPGLSVEQFVAPHVNRDVVLRLDLKDFFPSITRPRVAAVFRVAGYPERVATILGALCTNTTPWAIFESAGVDQGNARYRLTQLYGRPHLPQGAPSSPALANLVAYRLDCRLTGLAKAANATYRRYADDLLFSGGADFARHVDRFYIHACAIALEEGFEVNTRKTRMMRRSVSQKAAGLVLNEFPNIPREEFDRLKAILHNCAVGGPASQNRDGHPQFAAHLLGRIAHVGRFSPARATKLRAAFDRIAWDE